jgi:hypothetical protein
MSKKESSLFLFFSLRFTLICASAIQTSLVLKNLFFTLSPLLSGSTVVWFQDGILKPYVVFFGDNVPKPRVEQVGFSFCRYSYRYRYRYTCIVIYFTIAVLLFHALFHLKRLLLTY